MNGGRSNSSAVLDRIPSDLLDGAREDLTIDFDYHELASQARSEDDKGSYIRGQPRFVNFKSGTSLLTL